MEAGGETDLRASFKEFAARSRQLGLTVIISDFLDPGGFEAGIKILRTLGHDVFVVHITSERDRNPGAFGEVRFVDSETGELREVEVTPRLASAYVKRGRPTPRSSSTSAGVTTSAMFAPTRRSPSTTSSSRPSPGAVRRVTFGAVPAWLGWLILAAAGALAVRIFLVRLRPPRMFLPSLLLWRRVLDDAREQTLWERIRRAVSLVVTVLIALALALAAVRPGRSASSGQAAGTGRLLIVLDSSLSMEAATGRGETRWARAVAEAGACLPRLPVRNWRWRRPQTGWSRGPPRISPCSAHARSSEARRRRCGSLAAARRRELGPLHHRWSRGANRSTPPSRCTRYSNPPTTSASASRCGRRSRRGRRATPTSRSATSRGAEGAAARHARRSRALDREFDMGRPK